MKATVSDKGEITIPKRVRDRLGIVPGTVLEIEYIGDKIVAIKRQHDDRFAKWRGVGSLPGNISVDEYLANVRG